MSEVKVNKVSPQSGTTFTLGDAGDTFVVPSGATLDNQGTATGFVAASTAPTISSFTPTTITNAQTSITFTGTNYVRNPIITVIGSNGIIVQADTVTFSNSTTVSANFTLSVDQTYYVRIENPDGQAVQTATPDLTVSDAPTWVTASGSLGSIAGGSVASFTVEATSDSAVTYAIQTGALPGGLSLNTSTGAITGTESGATEETVYNFSIRATDAETQTADRSFSITVTVVINNGAQFN
jgi:hypothetical protein